MLEFDKLNICVAGRKLLFSEKPEVFEKGMVAIVGRNGAGKSTLLRTIMGLHQEYSGSVLLKGRPIHTYSRAELAKVIAMVYSRAELFGRHSGREVIALGRLPYQNILARLTDNDREKIDGIIQLLGIANFADRPFVQLSDGEKQLIMIGRAMAQETPVILLDEPGAFLDLVNKHRLMEVLHQITEKTNRLVLFSTHDTGFLEQFCERVILIGDEKLRVLDNAINYVQDIYQCFGIDNTFRS